MQFHSRLLYLCLCVCVFGSHSCVPFCTWLCFSHFSQYMRSSDACMLMNTNYSGFVSVCECTETNTAHRRTERAPRKANVELHFVVDLSKRKKKRRMKFIEYLVCAIAFEFGILFPICSLLWPYQIEIICFANRFERRLWYARCGYAIKSLLFRIMKTGNQPQNNTASYRECMLWLVAYDIHSHGYICRLQWQGEHRTHTYKRVHL